MRNYLELGKWNVVCDRCGLKHKNTELRKEWTGLMVCSKCWEPKHPQLMIRIPADNPAVPWARPEPIDTYITPGDPLLTEADDWLIAEDGSFLLTET
jgi:hypothetical protein